jgi:hypothetical protein
MYFFLMQCLRLLKKFHEIGIYEKAAGNIREIAEDNYYELALRGLEHVAPIYGIEELGEDVCCGGHVVHSFSDPAMPEYYRLCRLYEYKHSIAPNENPFVSKADEYFIECLNQTTGDFGSDFDDPEHPKALWIETCPERRACEFGLIDLVHGLMGFYRSEVESLRLELLRGPFVYLPALPEHKKPAKAKKPRKKAGVPLKKAG